MCECKYCKRSEEIDAIVHRRDVDELIKLIREMQEYEANVELDLNVCEATLDGSWPGSVERLEWALAKAKASDTLQSARESFASMPKWKQEYLRQHFWINAKPDSKDKQEAVNAK